MVAMIRTVTNKDVFLIVVSSHGVIVDGYVSERWLVGWFFLLGSGTVNVTLFVLRC